MIQDTIKDDIVSRFDKASQLLAAVLLGQMSWDLIGLLHHLKSLLALNNIAYLSLERNRGEDVSLLAVLSTYDKAWQLHYFARAYHKTDPLYLHCFQATSPFDWRSIRNSAPEAAAAFLKDAADYGVGRNGVTIPALNKPKGSSFVSFVSDLPDAEWDAFKLQHMGRLVTLASLIDAAATANTKLASKQVDLSKQEHQVLTWAARGKTGAEIATLMNLSYATVKKYTETARGKLGCENLTHAAATAVAIGLIRPMALKGFDSQAYSGHDRPDSV